MVIKKPCAVLAAAGDFNDHPLNTDCGSELHGTFFLGWHKEELVVSTRTFPADNYHPTMLYIRITNSTIITNDLAPPPLSWGITQSPR
jgi:hypothetical protein